MSVHTDGQGVALSRAEDMYAGVWGNVFRHPAKILYIHWTNSVIDSVELHHRFAE